MARGGRGCASAAAGKAVWALDFDGVVCDSVGELGRSAWRACAVAWPGEFSREEVVAREDEVVGKLQVARPAMETGYEFLLMARLFLDDVSTDEVLSGWPEPLLGEAERRYGAGRSELVPALSAARDAWMHDDPAGWTRANAIYAGVGEAVRELAARHEAYIVTTKGAAYAERILRDLAGVDLGPDRIFSTVETGQPKSVVLARLQEAHPEASGYSFVEDRAETLKKVAGTRGFESWRLVLADWGYNTSEERAEMEADSRFEVVDRDGLAQLFAEGGAAGEAACAPEGSPA